MTIQLSGLGGFDSTSVVTQLTAIAQQPITDLQTRASTTDSAVSSLSQFSSLLGSLKTAATALSTSGGFSSMAASSTDSAVVASVTGTALPSTYQISVSQLATAQKSRSDSQASATAALGQAGDLTLTNGSGTAVTVSIAATDSLSDIAKKITNSGARVAGTIINAGGSYRLSLQGLDTGAANGFTVTEGGTISLGLSKAANQVVASQDAKLKVDGLDVTSASNQVTGAIDGITLALTKTTTSDATLTVAADSTSLKQKINTFISAYNQVVSEGHFDAGYGTTKASNSVLAADTSIRRTLDMLSHNVAGQVSGATGAFTSLASVGVSLAKDGTMSFDSTKLDTALSKDPSSVAKLFVTDTTTGATGIMKTLADALDNTINGTNGNVKNRIAALQAQSKSYTASATKKQVQVDAYTAQLKAQFAALDQAMTKYQSMSSQLASLSSTSS